MFIALWIVALIVVARIGAVVRHRENAALSQRRQELFVNQQPVQPHSKGEVI
jgi:hypothetical protein